jgi:hypothetical protein
MLLVSASGFVPRVSTMIDAATRPTFESADRYALVAYPFAATRSPRHGSWR